MLADSVTRAPGHLMTMVNMVNNQAMEAQFNPSEFSETLGANYARQTVVGLSHQVLQFVHTENLRFDIELYFQSADGGEFQQQSNLAARKFIHAAVHPWRADSIRRGGAPRMLFIWPNLISLQCVVTSAKFSYIRFNRTLSPVVLTVKLTLEEIRDAHVTMEDILAQGTFRTPAGFEVE